MRLDQYPALSEIRGRRRVFADLDNRSSTVHHRSSLANPGPTPVDRSSAGPRMACDQRILMSGRTAVRDRTSLYGRSPGRVTGLNPGYPGRPRRGPEFGDRSSRTRRKVMERTGLNDYCRDQMPQLLLSNETR